MARGISLHIGVNVVDPSIWGSEMALRGCENDADTIRAIAESAGFEAQTLKSAEATRAAVKAGIADAAKALQPGDMFLLSYAGHGGRFEDPGGDEADEVDETWCLFDGELLDDELYALWPAFAEGVRVLVLSDSCHSGTMTRSLDPDWLSRSMTSRAAAAERKANAELYRSIKHAPASSAEIGATVRLLSGCKDYQESGEKNGHGLFTTAVKEVWNNGDFAGDYERFHAEVVARIPPEENQTPNHTVLGRAHESYDQQRPFTI